MNSERDALLRKLVELRSWPDILRGNDPRREILSRLVADGDIQAVPTIITVWSSRDELSEAAGRAIEHLLRDLTPARLAWLDEKMRAGEYVYFPARDAWWRLSPRAVRRLAKAARFNPTLVGVLALHGSGYVRGAALEVMGQIHDGREIPFLALRANDWVQPVADTAAKLLAQRLTPENRSAVIHALPFLARTINQRRRDHDWLRRPLRFVLLSDGGAEALASAGRFNSGTRRFAYDLMSTDGTRTESRVVMAGLRDSDGVIRVRAVKHLASSTDRESVAAILEPLLFDDPFPAVRKLVLTEIAERSPERLSHVLPLVLLDPSARVRMLAQYFASKQLPPLSARELYVNLLATEGLRQAVAIAGVGETGTREDFDVLASHLDAMQPRARRAALRACASLNANRAIPLALGALTDPAPSVGLTAVAVLTMNAAHLDFGAVSHRLDQLQHPAVRINLLALLKDAPKWDAGSYLLEAIIGPDRDIGARASILMNEWLRDFNRDQTQPRADQLARARDLLDAAAPRLSPETLKMVRFMLKPD
jgi:HEAT repeat protein